MHKRRLPDKRRFFGMQKYSKQMAYLEAKLMNF